MRNGKMMDRRAFIASGGALAACSALGVAPAGRRDDKMIWADLVHLGVNMWIDHDIGYPDDRHFTLQRKGPPSALQCDEAQWREIVARMRLRGLNMLVIDLAEGMVFPSHPELAVKGAWSPDRMRDEVARLKTLGIEAIPKINFSTSHDAWMGPFERMVSTRAYYDFCEDIIRDAAEIFGTPRYFHIGFDEESAHCQQGYDYCVVRQGDLWWHDLLRIVAAVEKRGMRPWMWSDAEWYRPEEYARRCPRSVLQSNWYYSVSFDKRVLAENKKREIVQQEVVQMHELDQVECYERLEKAGFDQVPCGGNWREEANLAETVKFCRDVIAPERLKGFLVAPWRRLTPPFRDVNLRGVDLMGDEIRKWTS